ncbi:MAG: M56 family metallopeptidase [Bacteroidaceae bacterium]|nr:M56 family metallopeptidase [Bacteroidaceae bacterium]
MITMFLLYQLKVAVMLASFYLLYALLMRRETLHTLNRTVLLSSLALSLILPFCKITIHKDAPTQVTVVPQFIAQTTSDVQAVPSAELIEENAQDLTVVAGTEVLAQSTQDITTSAPASETTDIKAATPKTWKDYLFYVWLAGTAFCLIKLAISIWSIILIIRRGRVACTRDGIHIIVTRSDTNPFSWMKYIVLSKDDYESGNTDAIIEHELSHVRNHHSWDLLLTDLFAAMQWFNPAIYDLRRSLQEVHEYQADNSVISHGYNTKSYQMMLIGKLALENGFSIANNFSKKNLSNRISMMNKKKSPFARAWKALFVPVITGLFLAATAVTVYDCKPNYAPVKIISENADFKTLQEYYGQGAFVAADYTPCTIIIRDDFETALVTVGNSRKEDLVELSFLPSYLQKQDDHEKIRANICLEDWLGDNWLNNYKPLESLEPLLEQLEEIGIRSLVFPTKEMLAESYYSTYKYARIYETDRKGQYEMVHNNLPVTGDANRIAQWITLLDIQYVAFFTYDKMPMEDVSAIMDVAKARGVMTFIACRPDVGEDVKVNARNIKHVFPYRATILPVKRNIKSEFKDKTLIQTVKALEDEYTTAYYKKAKKVVEHPISYSCDRWFSNSTILFCDDELIMILDPITMSRNSWCRPDEIKSLRVDGKDYKLIRQEGFQDFVNYPWVTADNYANGSLCWGPEYSKMYTTLHFEPIPMDSKYADLLQNECGEYSIRGMIFNLPAENRNPFAGTPYEKIQSVKTIGMTRLKDIPMGTGNASVPKMEFTDDKTTVLLELTMQAPFTTMGYIGSDITLKSEKTGQVYKLQGVEGAVLDRDFDRGGDHITTTVMLHFPAFDAADIISSMTQNDINRRTPTANGAEEMKTMTLEGTICHQKVSIPIIAPKEIPLVMP